MLSGSHPISEVAAGAGYADHSHLVRELAANDPEGNVRRFGTYQPAEPEPAPR